MSLSAETRVLDATKRCCERWGIAKVTIDDIAAEAGVSRATIYRMFPGGKDVLFEALRVRELEEFFDDPPRRASTAPPRSTTCSCAPSSPPRTSCATTSTSRSCSPPSPERRCSELTVEGVPRIIRFATTFLVPLAEPYLDRRRGPRRHRRAPPAHDLLLPRPERHRRPRRRDRPPGRSSARSSTHLHTPSGATQ